MSRLRTALKRYVGMRRHVHAAQLGFPLIDAGIADAVLAAKLRDRRARLVSFRMPIICSSVKRLRFISA